MLAGTLARLRSTLCTSSLVTLDATSHTSESRPAVVPSIAGGTSIPGRLSVALSRVPRNRRAVVNRRSHVHRPYNKRFGNLTDLLSGAPHTHLESHFIHNRVRSNG